MCDRSMKCAVCVCAVLMLLAAVPSPGADALPQMQVQIAQRKVIVPAGGCLVLRQGDEVLIRWRSDEGVQLHMHGYDLLVTLQPGEVLDTPFTARASGRYPVTSHGFGHADGQGRHGRALLYIEVQPR